jgi:hypothetical protein
VLFPVCSPNQMSNRTLILQGMEKVYSPDIN